MIVAPDPSLFLLLPLLALLPLLLRLFLLLLCLLFFFFPVERRRYEMSFLSAA